MFSIKLTKYYNSSNSIKEGMPLLTSVQIINGYNNTSKKRVGTKITTNMYYTEDIKNDIEKKIEEIDNYDEIVNKIKLLHLENLKNNYYTDTDEYRSSHWELEYDLFKIVGTYDNYIDEIKEIEKLIEFKSVKAKKKK